MKKKVLVVDLDGTLYTINTFHHFLKFLIIYAVKNFRIVLAFKIGIVIVFRLLKIITHARLKYNILKIIASRSDIDYQKFVSGILSNKRNIELLNDHSFDIKILATAAPSCYAEFIAKNENMDVCLGTDFPVAEFYSEFENIKETKKNSLINYLQLKGITEIDAFVTDHEDDLPILKIANRNIVVSPNNEFKQLLIKNNISFETIV